jgi:hypothetical protein
LVFDWEIFAMKKTITVIVMLALMFSCGPNHLATLERDDPAEDATIALEEGDPNKAINILTKALEGDSTNWIYVSILALAYAERAGINALTLAQNMASNSENGTSSSNEVTALFSILPDATDTNISDVDQAVALMITIPSDSRTTADVLKIVMFQTASLTLRTKKYDLNGDGVVSTAELLAMSSGDAVTILSQLASAAIAFASGGSSSSTDQAAASQITAIQTAIDSCSGVDQEAKLKNYLSNTGC